MTKAERTESLSYITSAIRNATEYATQSAYLVSFEIILASYIIYIYTLITYHYYIHHIHICLLHLRYVTNATEFITYGIAGIK